MRVVVYVEGRSDKDAMKALLSPLLERKRKEGVAIGFFEFPDGDRKKALLTKVPVKAANIILTVPGSIVVAVPDLYPRNKAFPHETADELTAGILARFESAVRRKNANELERAKGRFRAFCFKYDLEALVLAAEESLKARLEAPGLERTWRDPVEDQDHDHPPKRVVEQLFKDRNKPYVDTVDAPVILGSCAYQDISDRCPQCFKPFVQFLDQL